MKKKVILVEDNKQLQEQLQIALNSEQDIECLFAVSSAEEALEKIPGHNPDVILMDINLPGMSGINCLPELRKKVPNAEILMLTAYEENDNIFRALKSGASGYLMKSGHIEELFSAIREIHSGGSSFSGRVARKIARYFQKENYLGSESEKLSPREREVLDLFAAGYQYKELADKMDISAVTIRTYVKRICSKLHVNSRMEAIAKYRS